MPAAAFRMAGKVQAITQLVFLVGNWAALPNVARQGFRPDVYERGLWVTSPMLVVIILLSIAGLREVSLERLKSAYVATLNHGMSTSDRPAFPFAAEGHALATTSPSNGGDPKGCS